MLHSKYRSLAQEQRPTLRKVKPEIVTVKDGYDDSSTCRVCLQEGNIPIHGDDGFVDVSQDLNSCAGINVQKDDAYPKHLCENCNSLLQSAIQLRMTALYSEQVLKQKSIESVTGNIPMKSEHLQHLQRQHIRHDKCEPVDKHIRNKCIENKIDMPTQVDCDQKSFEDYKPPCDKQSSTHIINKNNAFNYKLMITKHNNTINSINSENNKGGSRDKSAKPHFFYCKRCHINFGTKLEYEVHTLSEKHKNFKEICPICNKEYDPIYFKQHLSHHNTEITHVCDICGKQFTIKGQFIQHRRIHFLEFPFKCSLCPYRGRDNYCLKLHIRTHSDLKPHKCPQCPKSCSSKNNLNKHILTHKAERDFKCDTCQRGFYRRTDLDRHIQAVHLGIKEHLCNTCGKAFGFRKQMMKHTLMVHKREKFQNGRKPLYLLADQQESSMQSKTV